MRAINELRAARKFSLGYYIKEQMTIRELTPEELANKLDISIPQLNRIMLGKQPLKREVAAKLGSCLKCHLNTG